MNQNVWFYVYLLYEHSPFISVLLSVCKLNCGVCVCRCASLCPSLLSISHFSLSGLCLLQLVDLINGHCPFWLVWLLCVCTSWMEITVLVYFSFSFANLDISFQVWLSTCMSTIILYFFLFSQIITSLPVFLQSLTVVLAWL